MQVLINNCCHQAEALPLPPPQFLHSNRSVKFWVLGELARKRGIWREKEGSAELQEAAAVVVTGSDGVASV